MLYLKKRSSFVLLSLIAALFPFNNIKGKSPRGKIANLKVNVLYKNASKNDTLSLDIMNVFYRGAATIRFLKTEKEAISSDGYYHFSIPVNKDGYFEISLVNNEDSSFIRQGITEPITPTYFFETTDSLTINIEKKLAHWRIFDFSTIYHYSFSGRGSEKLNLLQKRDSLLDYLPSDDDLPGGFDSNMVYHLPNLKRIMIGYNYLKKYKRYLSPMAYWVSQANLIYGKSEATFGRIGVQLSQKSSINNHSGNEAISIIGLSANIKGQYFRQLDSAFSIFHMPEFALLRANNYLEFCFFKVKSACLVKYGIASPENMFAWIVKNYRGEMRDRLLVYFFESYYNASNLRTQIKQAKAIIKSSYCKKELAKMEGRLNGKKAYNFSLSDINGKIVHLSDFKDKIVIMDFWFYGCGGCAALYHGVLSNVEKKFADDSNVVFISISIDKFERWKKGLLSGLYTSNNAINLYTDNEGFSNPMINYYGIAFYPTVIIVMNNRVVAYNPFLDDQEKLITIINKLEYKNEAVL